MASRIIPYYDTNARKKTRWLLCLFFVPPNAKHTQLSLTYYPLVFLLEHFQLPLEILPVPLGHLELGPRRDEGVLVLLLDSQLAREVAEVFLGLPQRLGELPVLLLHSVQSLLVAVQFFLLGLFEYGTD